MYLLIGEENGVLTDHGYAVGCCLQLHKVGLERSQLRWTLHAQHCAKKVQAVLAKEEQHNRRSLVLSSTFDARLYTAVEVPQPLQPSPRDDRVSSQITTARHGKTEDGDKPCACT